MSAITQVGFPSERIRTAADVVAWALHQCLAQHDALQLLSDSSTGPGSWSSRYHHLILDLKFDLCMLGLGRYLLVHVYILGHSNIIKTRIDVYGIRPDRIGLEAFLQRRPIRDVVDELILQPLSARSCRVHQLSAQASALIETVENLVANISIRDSCELLCLAVHSLFVNENLLLITLNQTPVINRERLQYLPSEWNRNSDVYRFEYSCLSRHSNRDTSIADIVMTCVPFRTANQLIVTVQSNVIRSDFCNAARRATVKLLVKRFVDAHLKLKNLPLFISIICNSISNITWMPVYSSDSLHLPAWILLVCYTFLDHRDLCKIRSVSPYFRQLCLNSFLWKTLYCRTFGSSGNERMPELHDWRTGFIMKWRQQSRNK